MKQLLSGVALATLLMTSGALAQSSPSAQSGAGAGGSTVPAASTSVNENRLKQDLQQAGFKNLEFVDAAYVVQATTQSGDTVVMAINPALTRTGTGSSGTATSGSGSSSSTQGGQQVRAMSQDQLREELQKSGFQNVQVVRAAYVINATTPSGERVAMTISPISSPGGGASGTMPGGNTQR